jgi:TPR repeat protein
MRLLLKKRAEANNSEAIYQLGIMYYHGDDDKKIKQDIGKALELFHRAAELGCALAYNNLGVMHCTGYGVNKDETKSKQYHEKGAMAGMQMLASLIELLSTG